MLILAVNVGSSSLKFQLLEMPEEHVVASGLVERIGFENGIFTIDARGEKRKKILNIPDQHSAVQLLLDALLRLNIVDRLEDIKGIGHRVVHGGELFTDSVLIDDDVMEKIERLNDLAPLHNPANVDGIKAFRDVLPDVPMVAVFDTAFHQTMEEEAYLYPVPYSWYTDYKVRRYGFHGTSHRYVAERAIELLGKPKEETRLITCHIGSGCSITAIKGGRSIDTSMGFTPLAGVMMGTRSGDIDPSIIPYMMEQTNLSIQDVIQALNKDSGLQGISGISSDMRDILESMKANDERAIRAFNLFVKRICDFIGSYFIELGGLDAIVFTAGIGENSAETREAIVRRLGALGIELDPEANQIRGKEAVISTPDSKVKVFVIPTNEEIVIARDTMRLILDVE
ncbi:MAG TPA: acetate kinase [Haloplasmataceae bacterium]